MNGVRDRVHHFAAETGRAHGSDLTVVVHLAYDLERQLERAGRDLFAGRAQAARFRQRQVSVVFDSRIAPAVIVIHLAACDTLEEAFKMVETVAIMTADRGAED